MPSFFWDGDTKMHCIADVVSTTKKNAYAHHIQRLMVTGNFAMLSGISPNDICDWYLSVYIDAYEWVEFNILNAYVGEYTPIHIYPINEED